MYEYKTINISLEPPVTDKHKRPTVESAANRWAKQGWRTVAVIPSQGPGYADSILIERPLNFRSAGIPAMQTIK